MTTAKSPSFQRKLTDFYAVRLAEFGPTARGMDWNSVQAQEARFEQLLPLFRHSGAAAAIIDYGCGYGALAEFIRAHGITIAYYGYDFNPAAVEVGRARFGARTDTHFTSDLSTPCRPCLRGTTALAAESSTNASILGRRVAVLHPSHNCRDVGSGMTRNRLQCPHLVFRSRKAPARPLLQRPLRALRLLQAPTLAGRGAPARLRPLRLHNHRPSCRVIQSGPSDRNGHARERYAVPGISVRFILRYVW